MSEIVVAPYDPNWPKVFEKEAEVIRKALGENCLKVHHVGSTSVSGLCAKPTIDIIVVVKDIAKVFDPLASIEYKSRGSYNIPSKQHFSGKNPDVNMHVYEPDDPEIELNLKFRDYLRSHPDVRDEYGALKLKLVSDKASHKKYGMFSKYGLGKDKLIKRILKAAGFDGLCMRFCTHYDEWETVKLFRQKYFFDKHSLKDPYTWSFDHKDHVHFVLYKGTEIIGYAHIQLWTDHRSALRIIVIDEPHRNQGHGSKFLNLVEKWLKQSGIKSLHIESSPEALPFYRKHKYANMPFNDPDGYEGDPSDTPVGKIL